MQAGAADFIEKPILADELVPAIDRAYARPRDDAKLESTRTAATARLAGLTERQHQVMAMILSGNPNKNIAADLCISQRTVENHRAAIMRKPKSKSIPALARLALGLVA
jgi:two-component system CheB/CheR fusion protein